MKKYREIKHLKIVEQMIFVLLLAVIVPTTVSAFIVNNIKKIVSLGYNKLYKIHYCKYIL